MGQSSAGHAQRMREGDGVWIARLRPGAQRGLVHQRAQREMRQENPPRFLPDQLGRLVSTGVKLLRSWSDPHRLDRRGAQV